VPSTSVIGDGFDNEIVAAFYKLSIDNDLQANNSKKLSKIRQMKTNTTKC
jgi:hypothetical protein